MVLEEEELYSLADAEIYRERNSGKYRDSIDFDPDAPAIDQRSGNSDFMDEILGIEG